MKLILSRITGLSYPQVCICIYKN